MTRKCGIQRKREDESKEEKKIKNVRKQRNQPLQKKPDTFRLRYTAQCEILCDRHRNGEKKCKSINKTTVKRT